MAALTRPYFHLLVLLVLAAVAAASPLPLNINLGAYSPAIVVGDGAIEFDSSKTDTTAESVLASTGTAVTTTAASADVKAVQAGSSSILSEPVRSPSFLHSSSRPVLYTNPKGLSPHPRLQGTESTAISQGC